MLKALLPYTLLAIVLFAISLVVGLHAPPELASSTLEELKQALQPLVALGPIVLLFIIFLNNAIKALAALGLGIILGIPPLIFIGANGFMLGAAVSALQAATRCEVIAASLAPHGIIEIPLLLLASALGFRIGMESVRFVIGRKSAMKAQLRNSMSIYLKWILTGLFIAAVIEVFITPLFILLAGGKELFVK